MSSDQKKHPRQNRRFWRRLWPALIILFFVGRACLFRPGTAYPGAHFNQGANAAWLGVEWVHAPHSEDEIAALAAELAQRQITTVYVFTRYRKAEGVFNPSYDHAQDFVRALKKYAPALNVQAWIGLPLQYVDLVDVSTRQEIADFCAQVLQDAGFDGIHLDPEPISSDNSYVLALLEETRAALGPGPTLSIATRRIWPFFPEYRWCVSGRWGWSAEYYRQVADCVDEIAVMVYDSGQFHPAFYRLWVKFQVINVTSALADSEVTLFIGVPTSEETTRTHRPATENMRSGLQGLIDGLNDSAAHPARVAGAAIYPYWETDGEEWGTYASLWLGEPAILRAEK